MKKLINKKVISIFLILILLLSLGFVYASNTSKEEESTNILSVDNSSVSAGSTFTLTIDITKINCDSFKLKINSDSVLEDASIFANNGIKTSLENGVLTLTGNKSDLTTEKIDISFKVPSTVTVGTQITINTKLYTTTNSTNSENTTESTQMTEVLAKEENILITVVEDKNNNNNSNSPDSNTPTNTNPTGDLQQIPSDNSKDSSNMNSSGISNIMTSSSNSNNTNNSMMSGTGNSGSNSTSTLTSGGSMNMNGSSSISETVTYNGSDNNYLSELSIDGYSLTTTFSKTNTSYFVSLPTGTTSININAIAENTSSSVCIYGNTSLKSGNNKILISVTSESGSVRTYRIYANVG